jgi:hypothetical protein
MMQTIEISSCKEGREQACVQPISYNLGVGV